MDVVEVLVAQKLGDAEVKAGARVLARRGDGVWLVLMNGAEHRVRLDALGALGSAKVIAAVERRSARDEEYAIAPS